MGEYRMKNSLFWSDSCSGVSKSRRAMMKSVVRGHEYDVKAIAAVFDIPDEYEEGYCSEYEARELMKEEVLVHLLGSDEETIRKVYQALKDDWYLFND